MVVFKQVEQTRVSKQENTLPFIKNSNIKAVRQLGMLPEFSKDNPCNTCIKRASNILAVSSWLSKEVYEETLAYHADKAISPHSHA